MPSSVLGFGRGKMAKIQHCPLAHTLTTGKVMSIVALVYTGVVNKVL